MRIGVIGAGAVGGTLAALLAQDGHEITLTARGDNARVLADEGLRLAGAFGSHTAPVSVAGALPTGLDLVACATKANDAASALAENRAALATGATPLLVVQNGLDAGAIGSAAVPGAMLAIGLATFAASLVAPGSVLVTGGGAIAIGSPPRATEASQAWFAALSPVIDTVLLDDLAGAQWTKLLFNQVNALPAITGLSVQQVVADPTLRALMAASMREAAAVARAQGIALAALPGLDSRLLAALDADDPHRAEEVPLALAAGMGDVPNPGSTLQSVRRGRATEIDSLNGAVVRAARTIGLDAPINAWLTDLVHEVERSGAFITPADLPALAPTGRHDP